MSFKKLKEQVFPDEELQPCLIECTLHQKMNIEYTSCCRDALITSSINCMTSFVSGFVIFMILGHMAETANLPIDKVATEGTPRYQSCQSPDDFFKKKPQIFHAELFVLYIKYLVCRSGPRFRCVSCCHSNTSGSTLLVHHIFPDAFDLGTRQFGMHHYQQHFVYMSFTYSNFH